MENFNGWFHELGSITEVHPSGSRFFSIIFIERYLASQVHHFLTLDHWVIGNYKSYFRGWLHNYGSRAMRNIILDDIDIEEGVFKNRVLDMLPSPEALLLPTMLEWSEEFFGSAYRFCDSMRKSLHLLAIEAEYNIVKSLGRDLRIDMS